MLLFKRKNIPTVPKAMYIILAPARDPNKKKSHRSPWTHQLSSPLFSYAMNYGREAVRGSSLRGRAERLTSPLTARFLHQGIMPPGTGGSRDVGGFSLSAYGERAAGWADSEQTQHYVGSPATQTAFRSDGLHSGKNSSSHFEPSRF